jgi:hypothetical protein
LLSALLVPLIPALLVMLSHHRFARLVAVVLAAQSRLLLGLGIAIARELALVGRQGRR